MNEGDLVLSVLQPDVLVNVMTVDHANGVRRHRIIAHTGPWKEDIRFLVKKRR